MERPELPAPGRLLAELLDRVLEVAGAPLGERQRRIGHASQLHALLRAGGRDRLPEVLARGVGVVAVRGAGAEDRPRGRAVAGLALELVVGARLELLHRGEPAALLDADLTLLGSHAAGKSTAGVYMLARRWAWPSRWSARTGE